MRVVIACIATACIAFAVAAATGLGAAKDVYVLRLGDLVRDPRTNLLCAARAAGTTLCTNGDINMRWSRSQVVIWQNATRRNSAPTIRHSPAWTAYTFPTCANRCTR